MQSDAKQAENEVAAATDPLSVATDIPQLHWQIRSFLKLARESSVLDVGCGQGDDLIALAKEQIGGSSRLVGMDASEDSIRAARDASSGDSRFSFLTADVTERLPFEDDSFDAVLSINALEAFPDKLSVLTEIHRVLRPDGHVLIAHFDWDSQLYDGSDKTAVRKLVHAYADWQQAWMAASDAWMGRRLWRTMNATTLFHGAIYPLALINTEYEPDAYGWQQAQSFQGLVKRGLADHDEVERFLGDLDDLQDRGEYLYSITMFVYVGRRR